MVNIRGHLYEDEQRILGIQTFIRVFPITSHFQKRRTRFLVRVLSFLPDAFPSTQYVRLLRCVLSFLCHEMTLI